MGGGCPPPIATNPHCNSFRTSCCCWLAWAREEMPVCSRIEYLVRFATADGISAAVMPFSAEVRFCTWLLMTLLALCRRLTLAPSWPRRAATCAIALLMSVNAVCAVDCVLRLSDARLTPFMLVLLNAVIFTAIVELPTVVESLRYTPMLLLLVVFAAAVGAAPAIWN